MADGTSGNPGIDTGDQSLVAENTPVGAAGVRQEDRNYKRLMRGRCYCQIIIPEVCCIDDSRSAALEERFT